MMAGMRNVEAGHELSAASAHPRASAAAPWIWWLSVEANEVSRASMRVRLTVRTIASRSLHMASPMVSSGKSLSSTPKGPSNSTPTWSRPKKPMAVNAATMGVHRPSCGASTNGSVNTKKIWKILSNWQ